MAVARSSSCGVAYVMDRFYGFIFTHNGAYAYRLVPLQRVTLLRRRAQATALLLCRIGCVVSYVQSDGRPQARSGDLPAPQSSKQEGGGQKVVGGTWQASNPRRRKRRVRGANDRDRRHRGAEDWVSSPSGVGAEPGRKKTILLLSKRVNA